MNYTIYTFYATKQCKIPHIYEGKKDNINWSIMILFISWNNIFIPQLWN